VLGQIAIAMHRRRRTVSEDCTKIMEGETATVSLHPRQRRAAKQQ